MVETPDAANLYVLNQGNNTVSDLSPQDLSTLASIPVGNTPAWATVRPDSQRLYVVTQGDGQLYTIRTDTNAVIAGSPQSVGRRRCQLRALRQNLNRLYVTNPDGGAVYVFDATTDPPTPHGQRDWHDQHSGSAYSGLTPPCSGSCLFLQHRDARIGGAFAGRHALLRGELCHGNIWIGVPRPECRCQPVRDPANDGVRCWELGGENYRVSSSRADGDSGRKGCNPLRWSPATFCAPVFPYTPASARFRMSAVAAADNSRVYASMCDGGSVAIVTTMTEYDLYGT